MENIDIRRGYPQTQDPKPVTEVPDIHLHEDEPTFIGEELYHAIGMKGRYTLWFKELCRRYGFLPERDYAVTTAENGRLTHWIGLPMARRVLGDSPYALAEPIMAMIRLAEERETPETPETLFRRGFRLLEAEIRNRAEENEQVLRQMQALARETRERAEGMVEVTIPGSFIARVGGKTNEQEEENHD